MAAPTSLRRLAVALLLASFAVGAPTLVAGVDSIPAEQSGERLPEATVTAVVGDVDRDGVRELVRLGPLPDDESHVGVEVISADADGQLTRHGMAPFRRLAGVEEQLEGSAVADERGMVAARIDEPARLLVWSVRGEERVLVVAIGTLQNPRACCLTIGELGLDARGRTAITELAAIPASASYIRAADLDADGTDELVVAEPPSATAPGRTPIYVLRWVGGTFNRLEGTLRVEPGTEVSEQLIQLGDSDGRPGQEVGLLANAGIPPGATLSRISLAGDGRLHVEQAQVGFAGPLVPVATSEGGRLLAGTPDGASSLLSWPAGAHRIVEERGSLRRGSPAGALGSGSAVRVLVLLNDALDQMNDRLSGVGITRSSPAAGVFGASILFPYVGPLPGGLDGSDAFVFQGGLLVALAATSSAERAIQARPIATLPDNTPIGTFGPEGLLIALAEGAVDPTRDGGQLLGPAGPRPGVAVTAALTSTVLTAEADDGRLEPALTGAVVIDRGPAGPLLITREGFSARIVAPAGSRILVFVEAGNADESIIVPPEGIVEVVVPTAGSQYPVRLVVITPSGHGYAAIWAVRVANTPPPLEVTAPGALVGFSVPIRGQTAPGASVTVDGQAVAVASDGTFSVDVGAGLFPRAVDIRAADPVGNEAARTVSVVGPLDYRQLPWIPIVAALTIVAGVALYLRVPRPSPAPARAAGDDAVLEEIE